MVELKTFAVHKIYLSLYSKYWASSSTGFLIRCPTQLCHQRKTLLRNKEPRVPSALRALRAMRSDGRDVSHRVLSLPINGKSPMFLSLNRLRRNSRSQAFGECWAFISVCRSVQPHLWILSGGLFLSVVREDFSTVFFKLFSRFEHHLPCSSVVHIAQVPPARRSRFCNRISIELQLQCLFFNVFLSTDVLNLPKFNIFTLSLIQGLTIVWIFCWTDVNRGLRNCRWESDAYQVVYCILVLVYRVLGCLFTWLPVSEIWWLSRDCLIDRNTDWLSCSSCLL